MLKVAHLEVLKTWDSANTEDLYRSSAQTLKKKATELHCKPTQVCIILSR